MCQKLRGEKKSSKLELSIFNNSKTAFLTNQIDNQIYEPQKQLHHISVCISIVQYRIVECIQSTRCLCLPSVYNMANNAKWLLMEQLKAI